ncbi:MAG: hypothetical protein IJ740_10755 [Ruminococcus sp.]|nr:hypothetical protein [Ruminococcus sp.]
MQKREKTLQEKKQEHTLIILSVVTLILSAVRLVLAIKLTEDRYLDK